ncbi:MAG: heat-inducible transcription repressor HrcA, partial [Leptospiraceae bacterium]|nr:heat-inducible transcription repressor HrcA [Leptospiraceae bacterium]
SMSAGIVVAPEKSYDTLKHVELIHVSGDEILMIIVTRSGSVIHKKLFLDGNMSQESLYQVSRFLNQNLMGRELEEISNLLEELKKDPDAPTPFHRTVEILKAGFQMEIKDEVEIYIDGLQNLVNQSREDNEIQLEKFFSLVEDKSFLRNFFRRYATTDRVTTYIGDKNDVRMSGISIVATSYRMGEKKIGSMGILGPQRMNYNKALPLVEFTSKLVSEMITRLSN